MKSILSIVVLISAIAFGFTTLILKTIGDIEVLQKAEANTLLSIANEVLTKNMEVKPVKNSAAKAAVATHYKLDAGQSRFFIDANSTGLLWFLGHKHHVAAREFTGSVEIMPDGLTPAALQLTVNTATLAETGDWFTEQERQIITNTIHKEVLETEKFPEAVFKSTQVTAKKTGENQYEAKVEGDLLLHGVTRHLTIPTKVVVTGDTLRATGKFEVERDDFNIKTHAIKGGTIRVANDMNLSFEVVARKS